MFLLYAALTLWAFLALCSAFAATFLHLEHKDREAGFVLFLGLAAPACILYGMLVGVAQFFVQWWDAVKAALQGE